ELAHARGHVNNIAEPDRLEEVGACIDQRNAHDAEDRGEFVRFDPECGVEQLPSAGVEDLEEAAVEHNARGVALAPFDGQLPAVGEGRHAGCLGPDTRTRIACPRYSGRPRGRKREAALRHIRLYARASTPCSFEEGNERSMLDAPSDASPSLSFSSSSSG